MQPLLGQLIEMRQALEGTVADKEMMLHIPDHALVFALGACPIGTAGPRLKPVMPGQVQKPGIKPHGFANAMFDRLNRQPI